MTVQLYEGCWGVTQIRERRGPIGLTKNDGLCNSHPFCDPDRFTYREDGSYGMKVGVSSPNDIIAVFSTEAEADAYLAGEADPELPDELTLFSDDQGNLSSWLPQGDKHYAASKWRKVYSTETSPPAPKPVTWPDGVSQMVFGSMTISIIEGDVPVVFLDDVDGNHSPSVIRQNHHPSFIRQLAALLLAAADKVEAGNG